VVADVGDLEFADYEESSDPNVIAEAQRIAESHLNGGVFGKTVPDYGLGLDPTFNVLMRSLTWKPLSQINIGDIVMGGATVTGVVREICPAQVASPGGHVVSAAQLIMHQGRWIRAAHIWPTTAGGGILYHIMVTGDQPFTVGGDGEVFVVRDYAEVETADIQAPYDKSVKGAATAN
jgi:hypothetical protein